MKKKLLAMAMAGIMTVGFGASVMAADGSVDTTNASAAPEGSIWGTVSAAPLTQMKATVPIKIDFALAADTTANNPNKMIVSDQYAIKVADDSGVGVKLTKINVLAQNSWSLATKENAAAETTDVKKINLNVGTKALLAGDNTIDGFTVAIGGEGKLNLSGQGSKAEITADNAVSGEQAFKVIYTIEQDK